jgi:predicted DNA-binding transcriptional regulator AlpA
VTVDLAQTTIGAPEVAELYGYSEWFVYQHADELPVPPIRVGRKLRWPTAPVLRSLGIES